MPSETDSPSSPLSASVRTALSVRNVVMLCAGVLAGASLVFLGKETVAVPNVARAEKSSGACPT